MTTPAEEKLLEQQRQIDYPRDVFDMLINGNSPYAFYLFQWVPYQTDAKLRRLKMWHDVKTFDGRVAHNIWPNADNCGPFKDSEVEFIRISRTQGFVIYLDPYTDVEFAKAQDAKKLPANLNTNTSSKT